MQVLFGVNLKIKPEDIAVLIGPNGAGKSTVLKSIFNLVDVYGGKIEYKNRGITKIPTHELIELGISYVPQGRQVFSTLTVKENLEMGAFLTKEKNLVEKRLKKVIDIHFPDLRKKLEDYAFSLSCSETKFSGHQISPSASIVANGDGLNSLYIFYF